MKDIKVIRSGNDHRIAMLFDDVNGLYLDKLKVEGSKVTPILLMHAVNELVKKDLQLPGPKTKNIQFIKAE